MLLLQSLVLAATAASQVSALALTSWDLTLLSGFTPSGRPGQSTFATLNATIVDSNSFLSSTANCSTQWDYATTRFAPLNKSFPCHSSNSKAKWTFELTNGTDITDFTIAFHVVDKTSSQGTIKLAGGDHFEVPTNLGYECGGSGVCYSSLKTDNYAIYEYPVKN